MVEIKTYCDHCQRVIANRKGNEPRPTIFIEEFREADLCVNCKEELQSIVDCFIHTGGIVL